METSGTVRHYADDAIDISYGPVENT